MVRRRLLLSAGHEGTWTMADFSAGQMLNLDRVVAMSRLRNPTAQGFTC